MSLWNILAVVESVVITLLFTRSHLRVISFSFILLVMIGSHGAAMGGNLAPVIPMQFHTSTLPMFETSLRDPALAKKALTDAIAAESIQREIDEYVSDLTRSKGARRADLIESLFENYTLLAQYYEDVLSGRLTKEGNPASRSDLTKARRGVVRYASLFRKTTKNKTRAARAGYHYYASLYFLGETSKASAGLKKLSGLNGYLKRRAELLVALHELDYGQANQQAKALHNLKSLIKPLPLRAAIVARLAVARKLAGLNSKGKKYKAANKDYRRFTYTASQRANGLGEKEKNEVIQYAVGIWRQAEGKRSDWLKPPLHLGGYANLTSIDALRERQALSHFSKKHYPASLKIYKRLAQTYEGSPLSGRLDENILTIEQARYHRTKSPRAYEATLVVLKNKYQAENILGAGGNQKAEQIKNKVSTLHRSLVDREMNAARRQQASRQTRRQALGVIARFIQTSDQDSERERYTAAMGQIYALDKQHAKAVTIFTDLALNGSPSNKSVYLGAAIQSQQVLAKWSAQPPWNGSPAGSANERTKLRDLYKMQADLNPKAPRWDTLAHLGLLHLKLGEKQEAYKIWQTGLEASSSSRHASLATGYMLHDHEKSQRWQPLEDLARFAIKKGIRPIYGRQTLRPVAILATALFEGGRARFAKKEFQLAWTKLKEFTEVYRQHKDRAEGLFILANAYRGDGKHADSIAALKDLEANHKSSPFYPKALLAGGRWSIEIAFEEEAIYFFQRYANQYKSQKNADSVRESLTMLYEGRELYAEAIATLRDQLGSKYLNNDAKLATAELLTDLEWRHGSNERAFQHTNAILKYAGNDHAAQARALSFQARHHNEKNNLAALTTLEKTLAAMPSESEVSESLAETRYFLAERKKSLNEGEIYNLTLTNPLQTLNTEYHKYRQIRAAYEHVCAAGQTSYCAPAQYQIANQAGHLITRIEDIQIPESLAKETVDQFESRKQKIIDALGNDDVAFNQKSFMTVSEGSTNPDWTQQILWENSTDWNFDRITGETGNGYIQFSPGMIER